MARDYPCDFCGAETAMFMVGNLANGDQQAVGLLCIPQFAQQLLELANIVYLATEKEQAGDPASSTEQTGAAPAAPRRRGRRGVAVDGAGDRPAVETQGGDSTAAG